MGALDMHVLCATQHKADRSIDQQRVDSPIWCADLQAVCSVNMCCLLGRLAWVDAQGLRGGQGLRGL